MPGRSTLFLIFLLIFSLAQFAWGNIQAVTSDDNRKDRSSRKIDEKLLSTQNSLSVADSSKMNIGSFKTGTGSDNATLPKTLPDVLSVTNVNSPVNSPSTQNATSAQNATSSQNTPSRQNAAVSPNIDPVQNVQVESAKQQQDSSSLNGLSHDVTEKKLLEAVPPEKRPHDATLTATPESLTKSEKESVSVNHDPKSTEKQTPENENQTLRIYQKLAGPKSLLQTFLYEEHRARYKNAILMIDFTHHPELRLLERQELANKLAIILRRLKNLTIAELPNEEYKDNIYILWPDRTFKAIELVRQPEGYWQFSSATITDIPQTYELIKNRRPIFAKENWMHYFPEFFFHDFLGMYVIQWIFSGLFFLIGIIFFKFSPRLITWIVSLFTRFLADNPEYKKRLIRAFRPLAYFGTGWLWELGLIYVQAPPVLLAVAEKIIHPLGIVMAAVTAIRLLDFITRRVHEKRRKSDKQVRHILIDLSSKTIKLVVLAFGLIAIAQVFGISAWGIVSGMGIGGIAVALAAQNSIANVFGCLTILLDKPFEVGDFIVFNGTEGKVEHVGLRSTRLRTTDDSRLTIPNTDLANAVIDNMGHHGARRIKIKLGLQFDTPAPIIKAFCSGLTVIIRSTEHIRKEDVYVHLEALGDFSVDVLVICYIMAGTFKEETHTHEQLLFSIIALAEELDIAFAFPTQTLYENQFTDKEYPLVHEIKKANSVNEFGNAAAEKVLERQKIKKGINK